MATRQDELFDSSEAVDRSPWTKALERYRMKGMSEQEIGKYREAYKKKQAAEKVSSLASKSKK